MNMYGRGILDISEEPLRCRDDGKAQAKVTVSGYNCLSTISPVISILHYFGTYFCCNVLHHFSGFKSERGKGRTLCSERAYGLYCAPELPDCYCGYQSGREEHKKRVAVIIFFENKYMAIL